jgi:hypothetical protein
MAAGLLLSGIPVPAMSGNMQKVAVSVLERKRKMRCLLI